MTKQQCPDCGSEIEVATWRPRQAWTGDVVPPELPSSIQPDAPTENADGRDRRTPQPWSRRRAAREQQG
jgi:hypothetical protein